MSDITADVRTRMEGGVEHLEAMLFAFDRYERALEANELLTPSLEAIRQHDANATGAAQRASKFPELTPLLASLAQARTQLDSRVTSLFRELRLEPPPTFEQRLSAAEPHLPVLYRAALESSGLAWAGAVIAAAVAAEVAWSNVPWVAVVPLAAGLGGLLWDRSRARMVIVTQTQLVVGYRSVPLKSVRRVHVPRDGGGYRWQVDVDDASDLEVPAATALLEALRAAGVEVRSE